tara:strand:+ start:272 stop:709 length:438 start_codon:yes stop_codon:yes gene_type:complete
MNLLEQKITDQSLIQKLIPQREPMIMVDTLLYYNKTKVIGGLTIKNSNMFVQDGAFSEPGIIEHMAQTVALHTGYSFYINNLVAPEGYIGAIKSVTITKLPKVNDKLETEVEILQKIFEVTLVKGKTRLNNEVIMIANMKTVEKK